MQSYRTAYTAAMSKLLGVHFASTWIAGEESRSSYVLIRILGKFLDIIAVQSNADQSYLSKLFPEKNVPISRGGVDDDLFNVDIDFKINVIMENLRKKHLALIWIGRLAPEKDPSTLLYACKIIKERDISFETKIIGSGEMLERVKKAVQELEMSENVKVLGFLPRDKVIREMRASDILVHSSTSEGLPNVLLEAMAMGLLVVTTPVGAIGDVISNGENGFLFPPGRYDVLAKTLESLTNSSLPSDKVRRLISNANSQALRKLRGSVVNQKLLDLFRSTSKSDENHRIGGTHG